MRPFILFSHSGEVPEALHPMRDGVEIVRISNLTEVKGESRPAVLILTAELADDDGLASLPAHVTVLARGPDGRRGRRSSLPRPR